jgi:hypothetical protein
VRWWRGRACATIVHVTDPAAPDVLLALGRLGFGEHDVLPFTVVFEVMGVHEAVDLAAELRESGRGPVRVRPASPRPSSAMRWTVVLSTSPLPLRRSILRLVEEEMRAAAQRRGGRRLLGLWPLMTHPGSDEPA